MSKRFYLSCVHLAVKIYTLCLLCKYNRYVEILCRNAGNTDTGSLDGKDLVDWTVVKTFLEFFTDLIDQVNIHLMIQKAVHFLKYFLLLLRRLSEFCLLKAA